MSVIYKLPVINIIIEAFWVPWKYKLQFFNMLALPMILVVGITSIWSEIAIENRSFNLILYLIYVLSISFFAIKCHRFILISHKVKAPSINFSMLKRVIAFFIWLIIVYIVAGITLAVLLTLAMNTFSDGELMKTSHQFTDKNFSWLKLVIMLPAGYVLARLSLVFPAIAIDERTSMKWSWKVSQNNGIRMLVLIGALPWILTIFLDLLWRENGTMLEYVILSVLGYIVVAIEIFILSLVFKEFYRKEQLVKKE